MSHRITLLKNPRFNNPNPLIIHQGTLLEKRGIQDAEAFTRRQFTPDCYDPPLEVSKPELVLLWAVVLGGCVVWGLAMCWMGVL